MEVTDERKREILHNFMNTKYEEVKGYGKPINYSVLVFEDVMEVGFRYFDVKNKAKNDLNYTDVAQMIDAMGEAGDQDEFMKYFYYVSLIRLARFIQTVSENNITTKMIVSLPLKEFYRLLEQENQDKRLDEECYNVLHEIKGMFPNMKTEASLKEILRSCDSRVCTPWVPYLASIEAFQRSVLDAYRLIGRIMINSFKLAYPERFRASDIRQKYMTSLYWEG